MQLGSGFLVRIFDLLSGFSAARLGFPGGSADWAILQLRSGRFPPLFRTRSKAARPEASEARHRQKKRKQIFCKRSPHFLYAHGTFKDVSPEQAERIAAHPKVKATGVRKVIGITAEAVSYTHLDVYKRQSHR